MKHKILIITIEEKPVIRNVWKSKLPDRPDGGYADIQTTGEVEEKIYEQTIERDIDLMAVINAFNQEK